MWRGLATLNRTAGKPNMAASTETLGDLVGTIGVYQRDGTKKGRSLKCGSVHRTGNRIWVSIPGHLLNTILAADMRKAARELGFGDNTELSFSVLGKDGRPVGGFGEAADGSSNDSIDVTADDQNPF